MSFKFIKTNIGLILLSLGLVSILAFAGFLLWLQLQSNVNLLENKIIELDKQVEALPKKDKFVLEKLSLKKEIVSLEKDRITLQNNAYGTIVQAVGALSIIATAFFTWRNVRTAEANLEATEEKLVTERFSKAVELLASGDLTARLGGIYALERIAKDSEKDYWQVMEVLTAFVRHNVPIEKDAEPSKKDTIIIDDRDDYDYDYNFPYEPDVYPDSLGRLCRDVIIRNENFTMRVDIQAVLIILGCRYQSDKYNNQRILDLKKTDLSGAIFTKYLNNVNFERVRIQFAVLDGANFSHSNFNYALMSRISAKEAIFKKANLDNAILFEANLTGAILEGTSLKAAKLYEAILKDAIIDEDTDFSEAEGLNIEQIRSAKDWEKGIYSQDFKEKLGIV